MLQASRSNTNDVTFTLHVETDPRAKAEFEAMKRAGVETQAALRGQGVGPGQSAGGIGGNRWGDLQKEVDAAKERIKLRKEEAALQQQIDKTASQTNRNYSQQREAISRTLHGVESLSRAYLAMGIALDGVSEKSVKSIASMVAATEGLRGAMALGTQSAAYYAANPSMRRGLAAGAGITGAAIVSGVSGWQMGKSIRYSTGIGEWIDRNIYGFNDDDIKYGHIAAGDIEDPTIERNKRLASHQRRLTERQDRAFSNSLRMGSLDYGQAALMSSLTGDYEGEMNLNRNRVEMLQGNRDRLGVSWESGIASEQEIIKLLERRRGIEQQIAQAKEQAIMKSIRGAEQEVSLAERALQAAKAKSDVARGEYESGLERYGASTPADRARADRIAKQIAEGKPTSLADREFFSGYAPGVTRELNMQAGLSSDYDKKPLGQLLTSRISAQQPAVDAAQKAFDEANKKVAEFRDKLAKTEEENRKIIIKAFESIGSAIKEAETKIQKLEGRISEANATRESAG